MKRWYIHVIPALAFLAIGCAKEVVLLRSDWNHIKPQLEYVSSTQPDGDTARVNALLIPEIDADFEAAEKK